jgi:hypothetical protein
MHRDILMSRRDVLAVGISLPPTQLQRSLVREIVLGATHVRLDSAATLANIQQSIGRAPIIAPPSLPADGAAWRVCYEVHSDAGKTFIEFNTGGLGASRVTGFELSNVYPNGPGQCGVLQYQGAQPRTDNNLLLGMSIEALERIMGKPQRIRNGTYQYRFEDSVAARAGIPSHGTLAHLDVIIDRAHVIALRAFYSTQY